MGNCQGMALVLLYQQSAADRLSITDPRRTLVLLAIPGPGTPQALLPVPHWHSPENPHQDRTLEPLPGHQ